MTPYRSKIDAFTGVVFPTKNRTCARVERLIESSTSQDNDQVSFKKTADTATVNDDLSSWHYIILWPLVEDVDRDVNRIDDFLQSIYSQVESGKIRSAIMDAIDYTDKLLKDDDRDAYSMCDSMLRKIDYSKIPSSVRRAFLMVTYFYKQRLPSRKLAYDRSLELLSSERGTDIAQQMLRTLA